MTCRTCLAALLLCVLNLCAASLLFAGGPANTAVFNGASRILNLGTSLSGPAGIAVDSFGNTYIADTNNNRIVAVAPDGTVSTLAISGLGTALNGPQGIATDAAGNLYIADSGNARIVVVTAAGTGSVLSMGSVSLGAAQGVTVDPSGNVFVADTANNRIVKVAAGGAAAVFTITGLGTALNGPAGVAVDTSGNLYIADSGNNRVAMVTPAGAATVLSFGSLTLSAPRGVAVDSFQNIYVADVNNNRIISSATNLAVNVVGDSLALPSAVAVDAFGTLYLADTGHNRVITEAVSAVDFGKLAPGSASPSTRSLSFTVTGSLGSVVALTVGAPSLDFTIASGSGITCSNATCTGTVQLQFNPRAAGLSRGAVVLADSSSNVLVTVPVFGVGLAPTVFLTPAKASVLPTGGVTVSYPFQVAIDGFGNQYFGNYVQDGTSPKVLKVSADGSTASTVSTGSVTLGMSVCGVALDGAGNLYIADHLNGRIVRVDTAGVATALSITAGGTPLGLPTELAMDAGGNLVISDYGIGRIVKVSATSLASGSTSLTGVVVPSPGQTFTPGTVSGVAVDGFGNTYIANRSHVIKATPAGTASIVATPGVTLIEPEGVTTDGGGNVYVADGGRIVQISTAGAASVVQYAGLPSPALSSTGYGVTVDATGALYIPDWTNNRFVKLDTTNPAPLAFANTAFGRTSTDSPKTVTVQNIGNEALTFPVPSSGSDPVVSPNFALSNTSTCPQVSSSSTAGTLAPAATCSLAVSFTPASAGAKTGSLALTDNTADAPGPSYAAQTVALSGTGTQSVPTITWSTPAAITYGTALGSTQLNAVASVPGTITYTPAAGTVLPVGAKTLSATFVPTDTTDYTNATATTVLTVGKATPALTWHTPAAIDYGTALSSTQLDATASAPGTITYTPAAGTVLPAGAMTLSATFVPTDTTDYTNATATTVLTVGKATPAVTWHTPAAITYGTALSSTQLDATASAPGTITYTPTTGTLLPAGSKTLSAAFVPTNTTDYTNATDTTTLTIGKSTSTVTVSTSSGTGTSEALSASVTAAYGTPTGTVQFSNGTTVLGSATLGTNGKATVTVASLPSGNITVTAAYSGDADYVASTGSTSVVITPPPSTQTPAYTLAASQTNITIHVKESAVVGLTFTPTGGFTGDVALSCQGLPDWLTCSFSPASFVADGSNQVQTGQLSIGGPGVARSVATADSGGPRIASFLMLPGVFLGGFFGWRRRHPGRGSRRLPLLGAIAALAVTGGCGVNHNDFPPTTVNVTVAASGSQGQSGQSVKLTIAIVP
jgi:sugar lactone lactonase YvrE